jgi:hypothetical protein
MKSENEVLVSVIFFEGSDSVYSMRLNFHPFYQVGQEIYINRMQTAFGLARYPKIEELRKHYKIISITHSIEETVTDDVLHFLRYEISVEEINPS